MSSANRGPKISPSEEYPTPPWVVERFLEECLKDLPLSSSLHWIEPCAGSGLIIKTVNSLVEPNPKWTAVEILPNYRKELIKIVPASRVCIENFLTTNFDTRFDVAITNPPYSLAYRVIQKSLRIADWVVMLLRVNWLGSDSRQKFLSAFAPDVHVLPNRPSFSTDGATDSTEYGWFVWGPPPRKRHYGAVTVLNTTPRAVRLQQRG